MQNDGVHDYNKCFYHVIHVYLHTKIQSPWVFIGTLNKGSTMLNTSNGSILKHESKINLWWIMVDL